MLNWTSIHGLVEKAIAIIKFQKERIVELETKLAEKEAACASDAEQLAALEAMLASGVEMHGQSTGNV